MRCKYGGGVDTLPVEASPVHNPLDSFAGIVEVDDESGIGQLGENYERGILEVVVLLEKIGFGLIERDT